MQSEEVIPKMKELMNDPNPRVSSNARWVIENLEGEL